METRSTECFHSREFLLGKTLIIMRGTSLARGAGWLDVPAPRGLSEAGGQKVQGQLGNGVRPCLKTKTVNGSGLVHARHWQGPGFHPWG